jgi:putative peptidoglycan lipid II flippase
VALGKIYEMRNSLAATIRSVLLLSLPAAIGLVILREPIVTMLYQRGEFTEYSTMLVSWALLWYGIGLVSHSVVEILARAFYSLHDTITPVIVGVFAMSFNVGFSYLFAAWFNRIGWLPHGGLALANTVATTIEMIGLLYFMRKKLEKLEGITIIQTLLKVLVAITIMSISLWIWMIKMNDQPAWLTAVGGIVIGAIVYGITLFVLKEEGVKSLLNMIKQKL